MLTKFLNIQIWLYIVCQQFKDRRIKTPFPNPKEIDVVQDLYSVCLVIEEFINLPKTPCNRTSFQISCDILAMSNHTVYSEESERSTNILVLNASVYFYPSADLFRSPAFLASEMVGVNLPTMHSFYLLCHNRLL